MTSSRTLGMFLIGSIFFTLTACTEEVVLMQPIGEQRSSVSIAGSDTSSQLSTSPALGFSSSADSEPILNSSISSISSLPPRLRLDIPFASQAPHGNWDMPYQEACEESSLALVKAYLEQEPMNADIMDRHILDLVAYEESQGMPADIDMLQLAQVAEAMYGYTTTVVEGNDVTIERIKAELAQGNPVIVPLAGQQLGNPYYSGLGPPYHVFVILGYNERNFITHDVGTRRGENYEYAYGTVMNAIHDWTGSKDTIEQGPKRMLVVRK